MKVFVPTQMRTGSTWLCDLLSDLLKTEWIFWVKGYNIKPPRFRQMIRSGGKNKVIKMHWTHPITICRQIPQGNKQNFVLSMTRDVKDITISMIMYARYDSVVAISPRLKPIFEARQMVKLKNAYDKDYINQFIKTQPYFESIVRYWKHYNDGFTHPNYMLVHYEDLINRPMITFKSITNFLGIDIKANRIRNILNRNNFKVKTGRNPGTGKDNNQFRRKGVVGDWKNYLNEESLKIIDKMLKNNG